MPIPTINLDFCSEPVNLHCPVCGQLIFTLGVQQESCPHVIFLADSASGNWSWQQKQYLQEFQLRLQQNYEEACKNGFYDSLEEYIMTVKVDKCATIASAVISRKSAFMLSVSTSDIGCGGMHNGTIYGAFDFLPETSSCPIIQSPGNLQTSSP
ncbi:MAG: hypothetical protein DRH06_10100 [Deltaproteobacteria bacterium]|nr:MAG: hypothetical protein DRH06_10100 [Deltaproteobacteria bacterium]